jgi:hypothetical protein
MIRLLFRWDTESLPEIMGCVRRRRDQDPITNDAYGAEYHDENAPHRVPIGEKSHGHVGDGAEKVAWDGEQLDLGRRPCADAIDDRRKEGRIS